MVLFGTDSPCLQELSIATTTSINKTRPNIRSNIIITFIYPTSHPWEAAAEATPAPPPTPTKNPAPPIQVRHPTDPTRHKPRNYSARGPGDASTHPTRGATATAMVNRTMEGIINRCRCRMCPRTIRRPSGMMPSPQMASRYFRRVPQPPCRGGRGLLRMKLSLL